MSMKLILILFFSTYASCELCHMVNPESANDCLKIKDSIVSVCCYKTIQNEKAGSETKKCLSMPNEEIGKFRMNYLNGIKTTVNCGNDFPTCGAEYTSDSKECFAAGENCCFEQYGSIGKCVSYPSKNFVVKFNKNRDIKVKCKDEEVISNNSSCFDFIRDWFKK